jgi:hypothetical protein
VSARIEVQVTGDEALVTVRGVIDRTTPGLAAGLEELGEGCRAVVVDLCEAVLASREGVEDLVASLRQQAGTDRIALVCDRLPGRRLLRLACGASGVRILDEVPPAAGRPPKPNRRVPDAERRRPRADQVAEAV